MIHDTKTELSYLFDVVLSEPSPGDSCQLGARCVANVTVINAAHSAGSLAFEDEEGEVEESDGHAWLTVQRRHGTSGVVACRWSVIDGTATSAADLGACQGGVITFDDGCLERVISIPVVDTRSMQRDVFFEVALSHATGGAAFGTPWRRSGADADSARARVVIRASRVRIEAVRSIAASLQQWPSAVLTPSGELSIAPVRLPAPSWGRQFGDAVACHGEGCLSSSLSLFALPWKVATTHTAVPGQCPPWPWHCAFYAGTARTLPAHRDL